MEKNAGEWTGSVEISKKDIPGSKRSKYGPREMLHQKSIELVPAGHFFVLVHDSVTDFGPVSGSIKELQLSSPIKLVSIK